MFFIRNDLYADINNHIVDKIAVGILINQEFAESKSTQYIIICHMIAKKQDMEYRYVYVNKTHKSTNA